MTTTAKDLVRLKELLKEKQERDSHPLRLYRPLPGGQNNFLLSKARKRILRGGNRAGKTVTCAMEFASAALGIPLYDKDGNEIEFKYPKDRPLVMWIIAVDLFHIARNIHRLLFKPGAFKVIKDEQTGQTRAVRPGCPNDKAREKEFKFSSPLIPEKFISEWSWENKAQRVFNVVRLTNGTEIYAFSSKGDAPQGDKCDLIWVDEDLANDEFIKEAAVRILDNGGRFMWSAFPHQGNEALIALSEEAERCDKEKPTCEEFVIRMSDNPHLNQEAVTDILSGMSEEERRSRDDGDFCTDYVSMFPAFSEFANGIRVEGNGQDAIDKAIAENNFEPPDDWTRYLVLDPGHARPAVLFAAVPPQHFDPLREPTIVVYDEIAVNRIDAEETARLVDKKARNQSFEAFIIDGHAGRQTSMGRGETIQQLYAAAFERHKLKSRSTGNGFVQGSDNVDAGNECIREGLKIRKDGHSKIRLIRDKVPNLVRQLKKYRKTITKDHVQDKPAPNQVDDLVHCLRYLAAFDPKYRKPDKSIAQQSPAYRAFLAFMGKKKTDVSVNCGPQYS